MARRSARSLADADEVRSVCGLVVRAEARVLRRSLRPVVWLVLEELMLDAVDIDGALVASVSARSIASDLGLDPGTVASALRVLRQRGFVGLARASGPCGRFGLSSYQLQTIDGLAVLAPCVDAPRPAPPHSATTHAVDDVETARRAPARGSRRTGLVDGQSTLDLGLDAR
jgi:hypothetical protein